MFVTWQELKLHLSHLAADTLRRLRDNLAVPEPKPLQHSHISNIIDPPMPKVRTLSDVIGPFMPKIRPLSSSNLLVKVNYHLGCGVNLMS